MEEHGVRIFRFVAVKLVEQGMLWVCRIFYFFQFGGNYNEANRIRQVGKTIWEELEPGITIDPDKWHHVVMENDRGVLRFFVDHKLLYEGRQETITMGPGQDRWAVA